MHTDERIKPIQIGNLTIQFKLASPSKLLWADKTFNLLRENGYAWEGMRRDVKRFVKQCPFCQKDKANVFKSGTAPYTLTSGGPGAGR